MSCQYQYTSFLPVDIVVHVPHFGLNIFRFSCSRLFLLVQVLYIVIRVYFSSLPSSYRSCDFIGLRAAPHVGAYLISRL